jgi:post-segregation antitoxin (ccd killing protein)
MNKKKARVNLYISKSLSDDAKRLGINMSSLLESALKKDIAEKWQLQNQPKIDAYNQLIEGDLPFDDDDLAL